MRVGLGFATSARRNRAMPICPFLLLHAAMAADSGEHKAEGWGWRRQGQDGFGRQRKFMYLQRPTKVTRKRKMLRQLLLLQQLQHCRPQTPASATAKTADPTPPPKRVLPPISGDEQRQVYKWMLEEKRKIKPRNAAEKNKINEEKALLKEFIRAESLPSLL